MYYNVYIMYIMYSIHKSLNQEVSNMEFKNNCAIQMMTDFYWDSQHCSGGPHL